MVVDEATFLIYPELDRFDKGLEECGIARFTPQKKLKYEHDMMTEFPKRLGCPQMRYSV